MGVALFQIKIMPESPTIDLEIIKSTAKECIEELTGKMTNVEEQPIAFGLKAVIVGIRIDEDIDSSKIEEVLANIDGVSSVQIIDYRRAIN